jgi:hypothetical protein
MLSVYSVHFKSNRGDPQTDMAKREEAARQLLVHAAEMESLYAKGAKVVTVIAGDFNTDPTDPRFGTEGTFALLRERFTWAWENIPVSERVTLPAKGRYPDASFDGFFVRGVKDFSCGPIPSEVSATISRLFLRIASHKRRYHYAGYVGRNISFCRLS